ncbi:uncharacterized protein DDB_G0283697-like [Macrobrachium rosenbergii]|uniref:uncharacterized protein DDB_G0283697-like n=1 Tax=Macrobrachium rosenbergii TaxID=79674 RepID=UPI0034D60D17
MGVGGPERALERNGERDGIADPAFVPAMCDTNAALDRDPPEGRGVWKLTVEATDGQATKSRQEEERNLIDRSEKNYNINSSIWPEEIVTRGNTIWKETSANKRNAQGLLRDDAAIRNERKQKVNSYTNPDEKRLNRKPAEQKKAWEHRQKRHNPYHRTDSQKLVKTDKNQDADMVGEKNEPKVKTNQRFFRKITSWKEIDPDIRADCENEKPNSIWEKIDTNRHQKKNAPKKERERQVWKPHDNERYPWIYREEDNQNSRSSHEKKYRYRNPKGPGVWNTQKRLEIGGNFDGNLKRGNEWVGKSVKAQGTPIRRQTKQRKKRDTLQQEKKHLVRTTQKWGEHKPVTLTTRKSLPGQEFGLGNYILNGRAPRGASGQESRRLLESRLRRLSKDNDDFDDDDDDDFGWDTNKGDDGRDDGTGSADDYEEYDDGSYNETDLEDYDGGGNATVDYDADDLGDYVGGSDGDAEEYYGDDIVNYK